ncbi:MAG: tryptophan 7-halogenase [Balneolales bacterium]|nr:tryptophan 7-halogenase [Balneolales bacterium]
MKPVEFPDYDFVIAGSGFSGSILAAALAKAGYSVLICEREDHPRFAVGESSTPIADMILRSISQKYSLDYLYPLSRYGSWKATKPDILCGAKRGFSYYRHEPGKSWGETLRDNPANKELLVAASISYEQSDTQWYRPHTDLYLLEQAVLAGAVYKPFSTICSFEKAGSGQYAITLQTKTTGSEEIKTRAISTRKLIDATGSAHFSETILGVEVRKTGFRTSSSAVFSHLSNVPDWSNILAGEGISQAGYPFYTDHAALHQLIDEGWIWMLRFDSGLLSCGLLTDTRHHHKQLPSFAANPQRYFEETISRYPSLSTLFSGASCALLPGKWLAANQLQRAAKSLCGDGWVMLPSSAGFTDPLHSTGIAHALSGVEKLLNHFLQPDFSFENDAGFYSDYNRIFEAEMQLIDLLIASCYATRSNMGLFEAATSLYFCCSVAYEQRRISGIIPEAFLNATNQQLSQTVSKMYGKIETWEKKGKNTTEAQQLIEEIGEALKPWNTVGLLDPSKNRMYAHTAAVF